MSLAGDREGRVSLREVPPPEGQGPPGFDGESIRGASEWMKFSHALWHNRGLVFACVLVALLLATGYNYTARPRYEATARIQITRATADLTPGADIVVAVTAEWVETQYALLLGKSLLTKVVSNHAFTNSRELVAGPMRSPVELIRTKLFGRDKEDFDTGIEVAPAVRAFRSRITVRPLPRTNLVDLIFKAYDPQFAADAANGLAQTFVNESKSERSNESAEATQWLAARLQAEQDVAESSFKALRSFEERSGSTNLEARERLAEARLQQASTQLLEARSAMASKKAYLDQLRRMSAAELVTLPELAASPTFQGMRKELIDLEFRRSDLDQSLGPKHPDVLGLDARIRGLKTTISVEANGVVRSVEAAYLAAARQEGVAASALASAQNEMSGLRDKSPEYQNLKRAADASNDIARAVAKREKEASVESTVTDRTVRLIEAAERPGSPVSPNRAANLQIALLVGLAGGILLVVAKERLDTTIKTPDDIRDFLGVRFMGFVPDLSTVVGMVMVQNPVGLRSPNSPLSEAYRVIRTNVLAAGSSMNARVLLVTSIHPGEGKSTTAMNLAAAIAQTGATAVLVDADMRRPAVHSNFGLARVPGLREILSGKASYRDWVRPSPIPGLSVLPAGATPANPAELLGCAEMRTLLEDLSRVYDWVILDAPPVGGMADALIIAGEVDGILLVVQGDRTTKTVAADGVAQLAAVGGGVLGAILNRVDVKRNSYYLSRYATGYYGQYGAYGGYGENRPGAGARTQEHRRGRK